MKTTQRGFIIPLLLVIIAILLAGGGAYLYTQTKSENPPVTENVTLPQATSTAQTTNQTSSSPADSIIGRLCGGGAMANGGACPAGYLCAIVTKGPPAEGTCQVATASPTISSIEVVEGLPTGSVYAGQTAEIFGTDLRGVVSVKIGEQNIPVMTGIIADRALDTNQAFKVPSLSAGVYNVSVTNSSMQTSAVYPVTVVVYSPKSTASQTADWKTYTNTEYGFEFKYPSDFVNYSENSTGVFFQLKGCESAMTEGGVGINNQKCRFYAALVQDKKIDVQGGLRTSTQMGTLVAEKVVVSEGNTTNVFIQAQYNGIWYIQELAYPPGTNHDVLDTIAQTFNFTSKQNSLTQPKINVVYPNGGEVWESGEPSLIRWNAFGLTNQDNVYISIQDMSSTNLVSTTINAGETPATQDQYSWEIPVDYKTGSMYKISVYTPHQTYIDSSDAYFTITK